MADIFVSYARVDDKPLNPAPQGWISTFVGNLGTLLSKHLGKSGAYDLWMDHKLQGNEPITPEIIEKVEQANILLLFLSPGYLVSEWCKKELETFLQRQKPQKQKIFIVELEPIERPEYLRELELLGYPFWKLKDNSRPTQLAVPQPKPEEREYFDSLDDLARDLCKEIKKYRSTVSATKQTHDEHFFHTIYLAQVPHSLYTVRENVRRYLEQQNVRVLPEGKLSLKNAEESIDAALSQAELFIQLLDDDDGQTLPRMQYDQCVKADKPAMLWRPAQVNLKEIDDPEHRQLLNSGEVIVAPLIEFQDMIKDRLFNKKDPTVKDKTEADLLVLIDASKQDQSLAKDTSRCLDKLGVSYTVPMQSEPGTTPKEIRKDFEDSLCCCDAVMMIFHKGPLQQLREHLRWCQRIKAKREKPFKIIAVYLEPGKPHVDPGIKLREQKIFEENPVTSVDSLVEAVKNE